MRTLRQAGVKRDFTRYKFVLVGSGFLCGTDEINVKVPVCLRPSYEVNLDAF